MKAQTCGGWLLLGSETLPLRLTIGNLLSISSRKVSLLQYIIQSWNLCARGSIETNIA